MIKSILVCAVSLLFVGHSSAGALEDGYAALQHKDFSKAYSLLLPLAKAGNASAQFNIGALYAAGLGVHQDDREAARWYLKAAEQHHENAELGLGMLYAEGRGVDQDYKKAMDWYLRAARHGNALAQNNIGSLYFNGLGVSKDDSRAAEWFEKAANQGVKAAENSLGGMYVNGRGVPKDVNAGLRWIMKAAEQGFPAAQTNAVNFYLQEARRGNPQAMHNVGTMCLRGWAGHHEPEECLAWYEQAARKGVDASRNSLAETYRKGLFGVPVDPEKARYWQSQIGKPADR